MDRHNLSESATTRRHLRCDSSFSEATTPKQPYYFEIQAAGNYETLATSETYVSKADAQHAIDLIKSGAAGATVVDET